MKTAARGPIAHGWDSLGFAHRTLADGSSAPISSELFALRFAQFVRLAGNVFGCLWMTARACEGEMTSLVENLAGEGASVVEVSEFARLAHERAFQLWLNLTLYEQCCEVALFIDGHMMGRAEVLRLLGDRRTILMLPPEHATPNERTLFESDLALIVGRFSS